MKLLKYIKSLYSIINSHFNKQRKINTLLKLFWWKVNQLFLHLPTIIELNNGIKCICYPESSYGGLVIYTKWPEYYEMNFVLSHISDRSVFLDVGANIGVFSLLVASKIKDGKIYAFEPSLRPLANFYENIKLNNLADLIKVENVAIYEKNSQVRLIESPISELNHFVYKGEDGSRGLLVRTVSLDSFLTKNKVPFVDFIKIDVEGAEMFVLKGLNNYLSRGKVKILLIEVNKNSKFYGIEPEEVLTYMYKFKYNLYYFSEYGKLKKLNKIIFPKGKSYLNIIASYKKI